MNGEQAIGEPLGGGIDLTTDVSFSPDGNGSSPGSSTGTWSSTTRRRDDRPSGSTSTRSSRPVAFAPDGKHVAVGTIDGQVRLFDPTHAGRPSGFPLDVGNAAVWQVAFSPDGRLLAVAVDPNGGGTGFYAQQRQGEVQLWDVGSRSRVGRAIVPGAGSVLALAFNPDGTLLATGSCAGGSTCGTWPPRPITASR